MVEKVSGCDNCKAIPICKYKIRCGDDGFRNVYIGGMGCPMSTKDEEEAYLQLLLEWANDVANGLSTISGMVRR